MRDEDIVIRKSEFEDFEEILGLYKKLGLDRGEVERDSSFLDWLYKNCSTVDGYSSFVSVKDGRITGHIGYIISNFRCGSKKITGVHPMDWIVDDENSGNSGLLLFEEWIKMGDFQFIIGGTKYAQKIYPFFEFDKVDDPKIYFRAIDSYKYSQAQPEFIAKRVARFLLHKKREVYSLKNRKMSGKIKLIDENLSTIEKNYYDASLIYNMIDENYLKWIVRCPDVECKLFSIEYDKKKYSPIILYMRKNNYGYKNGKIVYIPNFSSDYKLISEVIILLEEFLLENGCTELYTMSNSEIIDSSLNELGYSSYGTPLWVRDSKKILNNRKFYISSADGDTAYRGF